MRRHHLPWLPWTLRRRPGRSSRSSRWALIGVCALAFALRLGFAIGDPTIERPDELFQNIEPAWRMWSGYGTVTWEWRIGLRSPLFPACLALLIAAASALGAGPAGYLAAIWAAMSALSTAVVAMSFRVGARHAGLQGALCCALPCAVWPDLVYFGSKPLGEVQGGNLLAIAALLVIGSARRRVPGDEDRRSGRLGVGMLGAGLPGIGVLLGLAFCLRPQLAPAIVAVAAAAACRAPRRQPGWLMAGAGIPLLALGAADWACYGVPFRSVWAQFQLNALQQVSREFGTSPRLWYGQELLRRWGLAVVPVAATASLGLGAAPLLGVLVLLVVLPHSLIAHKEVSFVQAAVAPTLVLAGLGACRCSRWWASLTGRKAGRWMTACLLASWLAIAAATGRGAGFLPLWTRDRADLEAMAALRDDPALCGLGVRWPRRWFWSAGDALLGRPVPIYAFGSAAGTRRVAPAIDAAIGGPDVADGLPGFTVTRCWPGGDGTVCLARAVHKRCLPDPGFDLDAVAGLGRPGTEHGADTP